MRPFRFLGPIGDGGTPDARALAAEARKAEDLGLDVLIRSDHLLEQHAALPVLAAVAAVTEHVRLATFVLNVDLRHPAVRAQELASIDVISGGRATRAATPRPARRRRSAGSGRRPATGSTRWSSTPTRPAGR